jgi:hypothetical protein
VANERWEAVQGQPRIFKLPGKRIVTLFLPFPAQNAIRLLLLPV